MLHKYSRLLCLSMSVFLDVLDNRSSERLHTLCVAGEPRNSSVE